MCDIYRIVGFGRDLLGSSSPAPLLKQGQLERVAQGCAQAGSECLCRDSTAPAGIALRHRSALPSQGPHLKQNTCAVVC